MTAAQRARWLAELSEALDDAQRLICDVGPSSMRDVDRLDLAARVEAARAEVRSLRLGHDDRFAERNAPEWTNQSLWSSASRFDD